MIFLALYTPRPSLQLRRSRDSSTRAALLTSFAPRLRGRIHRRRGYATLNRDVEVEMQDMSAGAQKNKKAKKDIGVRGERDEKYLLGKLMCELLR